MSSATLTSTIAHAPIQTQPLSGSACANCDELMEAAPIFFEILDDSVDSSELFDVAWLLIIPKEERADFDGTEELARQLSRSTGKKTYVVVDEPMIDAPESFHELTLDKLQNASDKFHVAVYAPDEQPPALSSELIGTLFSLELVKICQISKSLETAPYRRPLRGGRRVLFAFPGMFVPPRLGSQRRAVSMLLDLVAKDCDIDLLIFGGPEKERKKFEHRMRLVARNVYWVEVLPDDEVQRNLRRVAYKRLAKRYKVQEKFPMPLPERVKKYASPQAYREVASVLKTHRYDLIFSIYCWFIPLFAQRSAGTKLACDTQDVMFLREESFANRLSKLLFPPSRTREIECRLLRQCDLVCAISERDRVAFAEHLAEEKVALLQSRFASAPRVLRGPTNGRALRFGFIGSAMDANVRALESLFADWWPHIKKHSPDSPLLICGAVSEAARVKDLAFLDDEVRLLGFVKDVADFYRSIDVLLSPVVVSGGLNIKNVEALLQGVPVITNERGAAALAPLRLPFVAESGEDMLKAVARIETGGRDFEIEQSAVFREAAAMWGSSSGGDPLEHVLKPVS